MTKLANRYTYHNKDFLELDGENVIDFSKIPSNWEGFKLIRDMCTFGTKPVDDKVVVCHSGYSHGVTRYRVISNPLNMPSRLVALYCDGGNLCFGYHASGDEICVHTD